ncbi:MAG: cation transporter [Deltaproteobacteria bacterium]|nr:cation transporter [Deltaproteobacteria bacterium]
MESSHSHNLRDEQRWRLRVVLVITALYFATELVGGWLINSLALLSDAVHMLTDIAALCLGLFTLWISSLPATAGKTYGYQRAEILGALFNGLMLWLLVAFLWFEAAERLRKPPAVNGLPVMVIAAIGIAMNLSFAWITLRSRNFSAGMALRSVVIHVASDLIGSIGVLLAGALTYFGWRGADAGVSFLIGCLIIYGSWGLIREGVDILMEAVPASINLEELQKDLLGITGTRELHDLHVWCLTSHQFALSAHAVVAEDADQDRVLSDISTLLEHKFKIRHMTVQLGRDNRREREPKHF